MKNMKKVLFWMVSAIFMLSACNPSEEKKNSEKQTESVAWYKDATIYEVNIRQYTEEGTFQAFQKHLPRLQKLGVDILWIMPIHPIGEKNRKGTMGSYYSVRDYKEVNPEFGTKADFKALVDEAHHLGMYVIIDWVANHSSWDNPMITQHPEWYTKDSVGNMVAPFDWTDVADLDYSQQGLVDYMSGALSYWVSEFDIDGYRCDVAGMVPVEFWNRAVRDMNKIKPVFMLAEDEGELPLLDSAFNMHYGWEFHHHLNAVAQGKENVEAFRTYFEKIDTLMQADDIKMNFITNHDENSWNGTVNERMGDAQKAMAVIAYTVPGMPLIYSGQEIGLDKRLEFFEKDVIAWKENPLEGFYTKLNKLKAENAALNAGEYGGAFEILTSNDTEKVFAYKRTKESNEVVVVCNLSDVENSFSVNDIQGEYKDFFSGEKVVLDGNFKLDAWNYMVLIK